MQLASPPHPTESQSAQARPDSFHIVASHFKELLASFSIKNTCSLESLACAPSQTEWSRRHRTLTALIERLGLLSQLLLERVSTVIDGPDATDAFERLGCWPAEVFGSSPRQHDLHALCQSTRLPRRLPRIGLDQIGQEIST